MRPAMSILLTELEYVSKITPMAPQPSLGQPAAARGIALMRLAMSIRQLGSNNVSKITDRKYGTFLPQAIPALSRSLGLTNGTEYLMSLIAVNDAGESAASNQCVRYSRAATAPDAPTHRLDIEPGDAQVSISRHAVADDGGSPITGYTAMCPSAHRVSIGTARPHPSQSQGLPTVRRMSV